MTLRLRQIAVAVADLDGACSQAEKVFGVSEPYRDPGVARYGLCNAVYRLGNTFLELLSPTIEDTTVGRFLAKQGGDCGYMVILQTDAIEEARTRIAVEGVRVVDRLDRNGAGFTHLHPRDVGGTLLSLDYMPQWQDWEWAGSGWQDKQASDTPIAAVEIHGVDPLGMARRWSDLLGQSCSSADGQRSIKLDEGDLRFASASGGREGLAGFDLRATDWKRTRDAAARYGFLSPDGVLDIWGMTVRLVGEG